MSNTLFSQRHYTAVQAVLHEAGRRIRAGLEYRPCCEQAHEAICEQVANLFEADNERFHRDRFLEECQR